MKNLLKDIKVNLKRTIEKGKKIREEMTKIERIINTITLIIGFIFIIAIFLSEFVLPLKK